MNIFRVLKLSHDEEVTLIQLHWVMDNDKKGFEIIEMFCGESLIDLERIPGIPKEQADKLQYTSKPVGDIN